ncbi:S8 family serine peptidase [Butyricimonas paravirosa]
MKKYLLVLVFSIAVSFTYAQLIHDGAQGQKQSDMDWYNCSFDKDSVYGAEVNRAYEFLKKKKIKKRPIVALIGFGMDVEHEDLKENIWINPKEKNNGKDNDKNGLVGDINGWNFLGGKDGAVMEMTMSEGDREFFRLEHKKYGNYLFDGKDYFKMIDGKKTKVEAPANLDEYHYYRDVIVHESRVAGAYGGQQLSYLILAYAHQFDKMMRERFPNKELTQEDFGICYDPKGPRDSLSEVAFMYMIMGFSVSKTSSWDVVYNSIKEGQQIKLCETEYQQKLERFGSDNRKGIVGDNYLDINDNKYGNNVLLTADASVGTMQAGVVAAKRDNGLGIDGIANADIMTLRVAGSSGDPYLKDMALAIRYAVDHNADIIVLPGQNTLYPENQKKWISEALRYAEGKGVLVMVPTSEYAVDLSKDTFFPNRWMAGEKELTNLMVVASSDKSGNPSMSSNYGKKEVDLYAPGIDIYTTYTGDTYQTGKGAGLAVATTAGVAALIKSYYPHLTGSQIRDLLLKNVTPRADVEVEKGIRLASGQQSQDLFLFGDLCLSGGILNAYQAVVAADKLQN